MDRVYQTIYHGELEKQLFYGPGAKLSRLIYATIAPLPAILAARLAGRFVAAGATK